MDILVVDVIVPPVWSVVDLPFVYAPKGVELVCNAEI